MENEGHRKRLRDKFLESGLDKFTNEEIIELLLTLATPRKDCKQPARDAMKKFGNLAGVLEASAEELESIDGVGKGNSLGVRLIQAVSRKFLRERMIGKDYIKSSANALDYFTHALRGQKHESFHALFLDTQNAILGEERLAEGIPAGVMIQPRLVIEKALARAATSIVIAHNHPGGSPEPSPDDIRLTRQLYFAARFTDLHLREHLIISRVGHYSFLNEGHIAAFETEFSRLTKKLWK